MIAAVMSFIYQHPFISGFILYWGSWKYLSNHQDGNNSVSKKED